MNRVIFFLGFLSLALAVFGIISYHLLGEVTRSLDVRYLSNRSYKDVTCSMNQLKFLNKCWCKAGWTGILCDEKVHVFDDCDCDLISKSSKRCAQLCLYSNESGIMKSVAGSWKVASDAEFDVWKGVFLADTTFFLVYILQQVLFS